MKCQYVTDIYPLYIDGDLSQETKAAVEAHLKTCANCQAVYQGERGFQEILKQDDIATPSGELDNRVRLQVKYKKLRSMALVLGMLLVFSFFNSYSTSRNNLYHHTLQMTRNVDSMRGLLYRNPQAWSSVAHYPHLISIHQAEAENIVRNLNWLERRKLSSSSLNLAQAELSAFMEIMELRATHGNLSSRDEQVLAEMLERFVELGLVLRDYMDLYNRRYSPRILSQPDLPRLVKAVECINELSRNYVLYNQVELAEISHEEAASVLRKTLGLSGLDLRIKGVRIFPLQRLPRPIYEFEVFSGETKVGLVHADIFTGQFKGFQGLAYPQGSVGQLPKERAQDKLSDILADSVFDYTIEFLDVDHNSEFGTELYTFMVSPTYQGYEVAHHGLIVKMDSRTGLPYSIAREDYSNYNYLLLPIPDINEAFSAQKALEQSSYAASNYSYQQTVLVRSALTGDFELAHVYQRHVGMYLHMNARTGEVEIPIYTIKSWYDLVQNFR